MIDINGKKYFKVFDLSKMNRANDPDGIITEEFLFKAAQNYDPENIHEAVFWSRHPRYFDDEPRTGGYIDSVLAIGKKFYVSFSEVLPWMKDLYESKEFKRCSAEFVIMTHQDKKLEYFYAMCPTNMPGVRGLPPLDAAQFADKNHLFAADDKIEKRFSFANNHFELPFKTKISTNMQNPQLVALAKKNNIAVSDSMTDDQIQSAIEVKFSELNSAKTEADTKLAQEKKTKAIELVESAIAAGKITAAEGENFAERKEALQKFAEADYAAAKIMFDGMTGDPEASLLKKSNLSSNKVDLKNKNTGSSDLSKVTFDDVISDPEKYFGRFTDEELQKMHKEDRRWKDITIGQLDSTKK